MADRRLQVFHTVARLLSFTKAAESLHMTQPAVTFQVYLTDKLDKPLRVGFTTSDGTAVADDDYTAASGTLSWPAGDGDPQTIEIDILEKLKRIYYFAKRMAKSMTPLDDTDELADLPGTSS